VIEGELKEKRRGEMTKETIHELNEVSGNAVSVLKRYFRTAITDAANENEDKKLPDRALTFLGRVNGMESTRLKAVALQFQIAKHMGMRGDPLRPLLMELNPENFASGGTLAPGPNDGELKA
jgi:hypothetical protein